MNFLRLNDPLLSVLFEDDDIIAIDKPYGFNAHTNDSKIEHSDFIQDGLIEIYQKNLNQKLHIIHRLDQTTTGVMIFGKSAEGAKKYAEYFFNRQVQKTYWFITKSVSSLRKSTPSEHKIDQAIIHKGKELDAITDFKLLNSNSGYQLWQALPHMGRNHQIRIHAQAANISILGDTKYDGAEYPFLCLHNCSIQFPNGLILNSKPPKYFEDLNLLNDVSNTKIIFEADRRLRLFSKASATDSLRLAHIKNKSLNKLNDVIIDQGTELPTNQRLQRNWVLNNSKNKNILNLFSGTGLFTLSAAQGHAAAITTVDLKKNNLNSLREKLDNHNLPQEAHKFLLRDSFTYVEQAASKNLKFDLIICDAPTFYRRESGIFKIEIEIQKLIELCLGCLSPNGTFLFSTISDDIYIDQIRDLFIQAQKKLGPAHLEINSILPSLDFELPDEKVQLKSFLVHLK